MMNAKITLALVSLAVLSSTLAIAPVLARTQTAELKATLEKAQKLSGEGKYLEAASLLTPLAGAAEKDLNFQLVYGANFYNLAGTQAAGSTLQLQHLKLAESAMGKALTLSPRNGFALNVRGLCRSRLGRTAEAVTDFQAAASAEPRNGRYQSNLAEEQLKLGKWALAQSTFSIAESLLRQENAAPRALADVLAKRSAASLGLSREPNAPPSETQRALAEAICAMKLDDKNPAALLAVADAWYALGEFSRAVYNLRQAKQLDPKISRVFTEEGAAKNAQGKTKLEENSGTKADFDAAVSAYDVRNFADAVKRFTSLLEKDPMKEYAFWANRARARRQLVEKETEAGDDPTMAALFPVLADHSTRVLLLYNASKSGEALSEALQDQAKEYEAIGAWSGAIASCELALKAVPGNSSVRMLLAGYRTKQSVALMESLPKNSAEALVALNDLLLREPGNLEFLKARAERLTDAKNPRALADLMAILVVSPEPENYARRGDYYLAQGKLDEALSDFEQAIILNFSQVDYRLARASVKRKKGDVAGAKKDYDDCRQQDKTIPAVKADLSDADAADKMRTDESRLSDRRFEEISNSRVTLTEDYVKKAEGLVKNKQGAAALMNCTKAIAQDSGYAPAYALRGQILMALRRPDMAILDFNKQVLLDPKSAQASLNRGNALAMVRRYDDAIKDYDRALALDPKLTEAQTNREIAKQKKGS
ncbi:tetratricopeptide repeat protein [Armatimonas sp.]|uniref:tetratricopeptide repeat protein n=1 Tax=Armatimonas sp. TaxID=1872638 RepID=UPI00286C0C27|nr:tetratricopeptide repeat protein [Armatimonas sp.]